MKGPCSWRLFCVGLAALGAVLASNGSAIGPASAATITFYMATTPPLDPPFKADISDYTVACSSVPSTHLVAKGASPVIVGGKSLTGPVSVQLPLVAGQEVQVTAAGRTYYIRCLPSDFPAYTSKVAGVSQTEGYLVTPTLGPTIGHYVIAFDRHGVPVWWYKDPNPSPASDAKFFTPTTIGWATGSVADGFYAMHGLDGSLKSTAGGPNLCLDGHDLQPLPNGNYLGIQDKYRNCPAVPSQCVDLSSWGMSSQAQVIDDVITEFTPANQIVWSWSVVDHIDVATANQNFHSEFPNVIHMNSIQYDGNGGIIWSARDLDAVYRIDMASGTITWKLGGSATPQSLTVFGNRYAAVFSGQHDARLLPNGRLTVQDNATLDGPQVRAVEFALDLSRKTATLVQQTVDARFPRPAFCCGGVDKLPEGNWLASWGTSKFVTELTPRGAPVVTVNYSPFISYRVATLGAPIGALRAGMDAMVPPLRL